MKYEEIIKKVYSIEKSNSNFPKNLLRLPPKEIPERIFVAGKIPDAPCIAIVGTRTPDAHGLQIAKTIASECAIRNITVISGGAFGIDIAAHTASLEGSGKTMVVLPGSIDMPSPQNHKNIFTKAVENGGCLISEHEKKTPAYSTLYLRRNRLIAALADCVIVIQARARSGALSTASWAHKLSVKLFAAGGSPLNPLYGGTNRLIYHKKATIITTIAELFREIETSIGILQKAVVDNQIKDEQLELPGNYKSEAKVISLLGTEPITADDIATEAQMSVEEVCKILLSLEINGLVLQVDPGRYVADKKLLPQKGSVRRTQKNKK